MRSTSQHVISQRFLLRTTRFSFDETHLFYQGEEWDFRVRYEHIAAPISYRLTTSSHWPRSWIIPLLLSLSPLYLLIEHAYKYNEINTDQLAFTGYILVIYCIYFIYYYFTRKKTTIVPSRAGNMLILQDRWQDEIIAKIQTERLRSLRRLATPDLANSPAEERAKLLWLQVEGAITSEECAKLAAEAET